MTDSNPIRSDAYIEGLFVAARYSAWFLINDSGAVRMRKD